MCDQFHTSFPCLADPNRTGYGQFGLGQGRLNQILGPAVMLRGLEAAAKGYLPRAVEGDARQLPGTFIIDREGIVRYARPARHAADHPAVDELVAALRTIASPPAAPAN